MGAFPCPALSGVRKFVRKYPGSKQMLRSPNGLISMSSVSANAAAVTEMIQVRDALVNNGSDLPRTVCLVAAYRPAPGTPRQPPIEPIHTTVPDLRWRMYGRKARFRFKGAKTLVLGKRVNAGLGG